MFVTVCWPCKIKTLTCTSVLVSALALTSFLVFVLILVHMSSRLFSCTCAHNKHTYYVIVYVACLATINTHISQQPSSDAHASTRPILTHPHALSSRIHTPYPQPPFLLLLILFPPSIATYLLFPVPVYNPPSNTFFHHSFLSCQHTTTPTRTRPPAKYYRHLAPSNRYVVFGVHFLLHDSRSFPF